MTEELLYPGSEGGKTKHLLKITMVAIVTVMLNTLLCINSAQAQGWPDVFDPNRRMAKKATRNSSRFGENLAMQYRTKLTRVRLA
jgi:hypothetical protein